MTTDMIRLMTRYVAKMRMNIGTAWPTPLIMVDPIRTISGYAIATARLEFLVRLRN